MDNEAGYRKFEPA